jgi:hypothetical protein
MRGRKRQEPEHESPHELRLCAIVDSLVTDISEKEAYLAFAHELMRTLRQPPRTPRSPSAFPGYSRRTKRVVQKWFERGLSGHLMWLIGEAVRAKARVTKLE